MGAFAETFQATDRETGRIVAVKLLREHLATDPVVAVRFQNEARTAATLQHSSVVAVLDHGRDGDVLYTVMELVDGGSLNELIRARAPLSVPAALEIIQGILQALEVIHRNSVVHRDVKPANILLTSDGKTKLGDFGIARAAHAGHLTKTGLTLGTAAYMAPEQALGDAVGPAADLYAAGVILFELLTGQLPFQGDDPLQVMYRQVHEQPPIPHALNPAIPASLSKALLRSLDKEPSRRYASAREMWNALERAGDGPSQDKSVIDTRHMRAITRTESMPFRVKRLATGLVAAGVILMSGVLGLSGFARGSTVGSATTPVSTSQKSSLIDILPKRTAPATATIPPTVVELGVASAEVSVPASTPTATPVPTTVSPTPTSPTELVTAPIIRSDAPEPTVQPTATTDQPSALPPSNDPEDRKDNTNSKDSKSSKDSKEPPAPSKDRKGSKDSKDSKQPKAPPKLPKGPQSSHRPPKGH